MDSWDKYILYDCIEEPDETEEPKLDFDKWYDINSIDLQEEYIEKNPDTIRTDEDMQDIENNGGFQSYCENEYDKYRGDD